MGERVGRSNNKDVKAGGGAGGRGRGGVSDGANAEDRAGVNDAFGGRGGAKSGANAGTLSKKLLGAVAAVVLAVACSVFGLQGTSGGGNGTANTTATTSTAASSTASATDAASSGASGQQESSASSDQVGTLTFRSEERLQSHYEKHGVQMGFSSAEEYLAAANAVVSNPEALHKLEAEDGDDVYYLESTGEFVVVSQKGYIRTYYLADKDYFDRQ